VKRSGRFGLFLAVVAAVSIATIAVVLAVLPPGGTFVDDDGNVHEPMIEAIAADGVTDGCGTNPSRYCPSDNVQRSEMAAFVVRAEGQAGNLPSYKGYFADVPKGQWYTPWVEKLYELGFTQGCDVAPLRFCPNDTVLRSDMAAFLVRQVEGETGLPKYKGYFADVPKGQWYTPYVERLYQLNITNGCLTGPLRYCPGDTVRRDQMASFLGRTYGLTPIVPPTTTTTTAPPPNGWSPVWPEDAAGIRNVEAWRSLVGQYWAADRVDCVLGIIYKESRGDPQALNVKSDAYGLMQHLGRYWKSRAGGAGFKDSNGLYASPFSARANIAAGAYLASSYSTWWSPWGYTPAYRTCPDSR